MPLDYHDWPPSDTVEMADLLAQRARTDRTSFIGLLSDVVTSYHHCFARATLAEDRARATLGRSQDLFKMEARVYEEVCTLLQAIWENRKGHN